MFDKSNELVLPSISTFITQQMKSDSNNNNNQYKYGQTTCRCLFGPPDHQEIAVMCDKQEQQERDRLLKRWGIDWKTGALLPVSNIRLLNATSQSAKAQKSRKAKQRLEETQNDENIENKYPAESILTKSVSDTDRLEENIRQPFTVMTNTTTNILLRRSVRKNLFPIAAKDDENVLNVPNRSMTNKPYNKQLQITDFWRLRKSPKSQHVLETKKVFTESRKSPSNNSRRKLTY